MMRVTRPGFAVSPYSNFVTAVWAVDAWSVYRLVADRRNTPVASNARSVVRIVSTVEDRFVAQPTDEPFATPAGETVCVRLFFASYA
jgi:hypothetical protein